MQQMTFKTARKKLRYYYRIKEIVEEYNLCSNDIIIVVSTTRNYSNRQENATIKKIDMLAKIADTEEALQKLPEEYKKYIELRFKDELSGRQAARQLYITHPHRFEDNVLSAYISALGFMPIRDPEMSEIKN